MSLQNLVQISSGSWVNPAEVSRIYTCKSFKEGEPDHVYVVCRGITAGFSLFGTEPSDHVISCDWPIERIHAALGLVSADELDARMQQGDSQ